MVRAIRLSCSKSVHRRQLEGHVCFLSRDTIRPCISRNFSCIANTRTGTTSSSSLCSPRPTFSYALLSLLELVSYLQIRLLIKTYIAQHLGDNTSAECPNAARESILPRQHVCDVGVSGTTLETQPPSHLPLVGCLLRSNYDGPGIEQSPRGTSGFNSIVWNSISGANCPYSTTLPKRTSSQGLRVCQWFMVLDRS